MNSYSYELLHGILNCIFWGAVGFWLGGTLAGNHMLMWVGLGVEWFIILVRVSIMIYFHNKLR